MLASPDMGAFAVTQVIDADGRRIRREIDLFLSGRGHGDAARGVAAVRERAEDSEPEFDGPLWLMPRAIRPTLFEEEAWAST